MVRSRALVAMPTILLCGLLTDARGQPGPESARRPDATALLDEVRKTYQTLPAYQFERVLLVQETGSDGTPATIAELTLATATANWSPVSGREPFPPINMDRFRMGTGTRRGDMLQVCGAGWCSTSSSTRRWRRGRFRTRGWSARRRSRWARSGESVT